MSPDDLSTAATDPGRDGTLLTVEHDPAADGVPVVTLSGELDLASVPTLIRVLDDIIARRPASVIFDVGGVSFIDSSGLAVLLSVTERATEVGLRRPTPAVQRIIDVTGLANILRTVV